jgi:Tfp pilus assembly protein PilO
MKFVEILILPIAMIGIIAALLWFVQPTYSEIKNLTQEIKTKEETLEKKQKLVIDIERLVNQYEDIEGRVSKVFYALPNKAEIPNVLVQLEALASENGMIFESSNFSKAQQSVQSKITSDSENNTASSSETADQQNSIEQIRSVSIDVSLIGSYENFKNYLRSLENNIRIMDITSISFSSSSDSSESSEERTSDIFSYSVQLKVYYQ